MPVLQHVSFFAFFAVQARPGWNSQVLEVERITVDASTHEESKWRRSMEMVTEI